MSQIEVKGQRAGYGRVSTLGQSLDIQEEKLVEAGCTKLFMEKKSGKSAKDRDQLQAALEWIREGDALVVTRLDRLARSVVDLASIAKMLEKKGADLIVLNQHIDTTTPTGKLTFHMLAAVGEFERELIAERIAEGRAKAAKAGVKMGRKPKLSDEQMQEIRKTFQQAGCNKAELAKHYGIGRATLYRIAGAS